MRQLIGQDSIDVRFFAPPADLAPCFTTFYRLEVDLPPGEVLEDWLQPEWSNLRFFTEKGPSAELPEGERIDGARFQATGPSSCPTHFTLGRTRMWGIGLFPLGWARFIGEDASEHANTVVDGERSPVFNRFAPLCEKLCTREYSDEQQFAILTEFFRKLADPPRDQRRIQKVHEVMVDPRLLQVEDFARKCGLSKRTLERVCARHFGFSPRLLLRRQRLMRSLAAFMLEPQASWSDVIDRHYHDQSHFVHEFHAFMRCTPSEYAAKPHPVMRAFMAERKRVWGSPAQTLDDPK
ncbi:AraC family transcriptional regulator [Qipengyuania sp. YG27]|uniref:AraC family transcriptional regulator n=1 Tax=Qipengyuania mesophila TaxID=2867246 RepID=A0ABS7JU67_9SPHN|nr:AraC family transcriptional regulator [Qipengyuania mesophila]MBX7501126.1 AraC family transcriptional regulator [Qipengyuania mesophila]